MKVLSFFSLVLCTAGLTNLVHAAEPAKFVLPDPVAVVEGKEIKAADVEKQLELVMQHSGKQASEVSDDQKLQAARNIVDELIVQQLVNTRSANTKVDDAEVDARYQQIAAQPNFEAQLKSRNMTAEQAKKQISEMMRERKWLESQLGEKAQVSEAEAKEFYDSHGSAFNAPETVRASHILILVPQDAKPEVVAEKQKAIEAVAQRISKGEDFAKVASEVSEDAGTKAKGGDLDFFPRTAMVPEFADAAFALKKGEVSKVVKTKFGFHIIKATDRQEAHKLSFDETKPKLIAYLGQQKQKDLTMQFLEDLKNKADVKNNMPPAVPPANAPSDKSK